MVDDIQSLPGRLDVFFWEMFSNLSDRPGGHHLEHWFLDQS